MKDITTMELPESMKQNIYCAFTQAAELLRLIFLEIQTLENKEREGPL